MDQLFHTGSLYDNIDKFANSLGYENAAIVMKLAMIPWDNVNERDAFIIALTGDNPKGGETRNFITTKAGGK